MSNFIGSLVTKTNTAPTVSAAPGRWTISEAAKYIAKETWPYSISTDPYLNQTSILLNGDGVEGGQNNTFLFESGNLANIGTYAGYFDGVGDYVNVADNAVLDLPGDFTIECWLYRIPRSGEATTRFLSKGNYQGGASEWLLYMDSVSGDLGFAWGNPNNAIALGNLGSYRWRHMAITRSGTTVRSFIDGNLTNTATINVDFTSAAPVRIGSDEGLSSTEQWSGYISNVRIIKGTALYTATFSVPTSPLTAVSGTGYSTSLLTCNSATFVDNSGNALTVTSAGNAVVATISAPAITRAGNTTQGSFNPYGDRWSNYFSAVATDFLTFPSNAATNLTTSNFTFEGWFNKVSGDPGANLIWWNGNSNSSGFAGLRVQLSNTGTLALLCSENGTSHQFTGDSTATYSNNTWNHVAAVRSGQTVTLYLNGVSVVSGSLSSAGASLYAGTLNYLNNLLFSTGTWKMVGYMSDVRLVLGSALYTSTFTPPTAPLQPVPGTALLTCQSNRFKDSSTNNFTVTKNGSVQVRPNNPYAPSKVYSPAHGSSMYFDGTGDYLTAPANTTFVFGTGDFTVECWLYLNAATNAAAIIGCWSGTTATSSWLLTQGNTNTSAIRFGVSDGTTNTFVESAAGALILGTWMHITASRASGVLKMFVNGVQHYSAAFANNISVSATLGVAATTAGTFLTTGYISDARVLKGTALYTAAFTPPTAPLSVTNQTTLLLTGKNASIYDATGKNTLETVNGAMTVTGRKKQGSGAMYFDGNGDYLSIPYNQDINITSGDFTIEGWIYFNSVSAYQFILANYSSTSWGIALFTNAAGTLNYFLSNTGSSWNIANGVLIGNVVVGQWYHFALVRSGSTFTPYLNGVVGTTTTSSSNLFNGGLPYTLGGIPTAGFSSFNGYIDDFRISKIARYTAAFTPPARAHGTL